jgi:hypothetical protein
LDVWNFYTWKDSFIVHWRGFPVRHNVKLTGVWQWAKIAVVRPVERRVRLFGLVLFRRDDGCVEGFKSGSPNKSLSLVLSAWISPAAAVEGMMAKLEVCPDSLLLRRGVIPMPRAEGIPRVAAVREPTMNRMAIMKMPARCSMVV